MEDDEEVQVVKFVKTCHSNKAKNILKLNCTTASISRNWLDPQGLNTNSRPKGIGRGRILLKIGKGDSTKEETKEMELVEPGSSGSSTHRRTDDSYYFDSYAHHGIHETMLKDTVRTLTYRDSMLENKHLFKDKVVLDIGCGTGILSMYAAQAGAARVIGIDFSNIADYARQIIADNGFSSTVTIIHGKVEEVELPDGIKKVDILISEWMGYCLLLESMLDTVLFARDKWLKFNGIIMPDKCSLFIAAIEDKENRDDRISWWKQYEEFDLASVEDVVVREARVTYVNPEQVVSSHFELIYIDINTVFKEELSLEQEFSLEVHKDTEIHAFVTYFTVDFSRCHTEVGFSTSPDSVRTHWRQTVFYLKKVMHAKKGEVIQGNFSLGKHWKNHRTLVISISFKFQGELSELDETQTYYVH